MRNHRNAVAVLIVILTWWVMLTGAAVHALSKHHRAPWMPTTDACQSPSLSDRQAVACDLAADSTYGPSREESR